MVGTVRKHFAHTTNQDYAQRGTKRSLSAKRFPVRPSRTFTNLDISGNQKPLTIDMMDTLKKFEGTLSSKTRVCVLNLRALRRTYLHIFQKPCSLCSPFEVEKRRSRLHVGFEPKGALESPPNKRLTVGPHGFGWNQPTVSQWKGPLHLMRAKVSRRFYMVEALKCEGGADGLERQTSPGERL